MTTELEQIEGLINAANQGSDQAHMKIIKALVDGARSPALRQYEANYYRRLLKADQAIVDLIHRAERGDVEAGQALRDVFIGSQGEDAHMSVPLLQYFRRCMAEQRAGQPMEQAFHLVPIPDVGTVVSGAVASVARGVGRPENTSEQDCVRRLEDIRLRELVRQEVPNHSGRGRLQSAKEAVAKATGEKPGRIRAAWESKDPIVYRLEKMDTRLRKAAEKNRTESRRKQIKRLKSAK